MFDVRCSKRKNAPLPGKEPGAVGCYHPTSNIQHPTVIGFTLVELQIALLLVALITVLLMSALHLGSQTWVKVSERQDTGEHRYQVMQFLRRHLANARFIRLRTGDGKIATSFFGDGEQVHFVAPFPSFHADGELYWWTLALAWREASRDYQLNAYYFPYVPGQQVEIAPDGSLLVAELYDDGSSNDRLADEDLQQEPRQLAIAEGVSDLALEYLYRDAHNRVEWVQQWEPDSNPPLAIRLNLSEASEDEEGIPLPELVVAPRFADQSLYVEGEQ